MNHASHTTHSDYSLSGLDLFLALLGLIGVVFFGLFLPSEHPDSSAVFEITSEDAVELSSAFLSEQELNVDGLLTSSTLTRNPDLLLKLQHALSRETAVEFLESENRNQIAAYFWKVQFLIPKDPENSGSISTNQVLYEVHLAQNGDILTFSEVARSLGAQGRRFGNPREKVNRAALAAVFMTDSTSGDAVAAQLRPLPDSLFTSSLYFDLSSTNPTSETSLIEDLTESRPIRVDSVAVHNLALFHLKRTVFRDSELKLNSIEIFESGGVKLARVAFESLQPVAGQNIKLALTIPATGTVSELKVEYAGEESKTESTATVFDIIGASLFGLLSLILIVVFFKRMIARLLDLKSAMIDAMVLGTMVGLVTILVVSEPMEAVNSSSLWLAILLNLVIFSFTAGGVAVFAFMVSGVTDSVVREFDDGKLKTMILLRHGDVNNRPLGASLLRGLSVAGLLLGLSVFCLSVLPQLSLEFDELLVSDSSAQPFVTILFKSFSAAYFYVLIWIVGVSSAALRRTKKSWLVFVLIALSGAVLDVGPFAVESAYTGVIVSAVFSLVLAFVYLRYDILTLLVAMFMSNMIWNLSEGFLVAGSTSWIDLMLCILFVLALLILGVLGVLSSRTGQDADSYVPGYVTEMAGQERVKRELEIAQQVQTFFLPRKMPTLESLEIAGMCLPATEVGGDYYDFVELENGRMAFILGDVSGKGIQAAFFMTLVKGIIQTLSRQGLGAAEVMRKLNHLFCMNAPAGTFISVIYGEFDPADSSFTFSRAGHNPAILFEAEKAKAIALQPKGMAIGFADGERFDTNIEQVTVYLKPGDSMVFYTDGFSEAMNRRRDLYGDDRLLNKVTQFGSKTASSILRLMTEDVHHFIEGMGRADDMTMVVLRLRPKEVHDA